MICVFIWCCHFWFALRVFFGWEEYEYRSIYTQKTLKTKLLKLNLIISRWTIDIFHLVWYLKHSHLPMCLFQCYSETEKSDEFCYVTGEVLVPTHAAVFRSLVDGYTLPFKLKLRGCSIRNFGSFWDCTLATSNGFFRERWCMGLCVVSQRWIWMIRNDLYQDFLVCFRVVSKFSMGFQVGD